MKPPIFLLLVLSFTSPLALPWAWFHSNTFGFCLTVAMFACHALLAYGTLCPNNQLFGSLITHFSPRNDREIWLTIDDGPDPHDTPRLLDLLDTADGAKATFFVRGDHARRYPELIREIVHRGHTLGNHTDTHPQSRFWCLGPGRLQREISHCNAALLDITGLVPTLFRAPVGMINPFVPGVVHANRLHTVGWSARGFDGVSTAAPDEVVRRIMVNLHPGGIVLLHEGKRSPNGDPLNVRVMKKLLPALRAGGWQPVLPALNLESKKG